MKRFHFILSPRRMAFFLVCFSMFFTPNVFAQDPGDVNASGAINQIDAVLIKNHLIERDLLTGEPLTRADANQDSSVDIADAIWTLNHFTPPELAPNVIVVDSVEELEALDYTSPTLILHWSGPGTYDIEPGDIVVGSDFNGFLLCVDSLTSTPEIITLQTSQASLTQAITNGYSTGNRVRLGPPKLASKSVRVVGTSTKGAIWDRVEWNLSGKVIYQDDIVTIDLPTAIFAFDPMVEIDWAIEGAQLEYFRAEAGGDFTIDLAARINAQIENEWDKKIPIPGTKYQQIYVQWTPTIPPLPIVEVVTFELVAKAHLEGDVFATIEPGFSYTLPVRVGAEYTAYNDSCGVKSALPFHPIPWRGSTGRQEATSLPASLSFPRSAWNSSTLPGPTSPSNPTLPLTAMLS